ncbi:MAG TPA: helix-turn-helix transcriptional regulator [Clostridia bacterium]|nr:helix-turn-helix transcriptional regulator [Clostridia bacterium]
MTTCEAVAKRIVALLKERNITQYRLEQITGVQHGSMQCIMNGRNKSVNLNTIMIIAKGFNMSVSEFLDDKLFESEYLELE